MQHFESAHTFALAAEEPGHNPEAGHILEVAENTLGAPVVAELAEAVVEIEQPAAVGAAQLAEVETEAFVAEQVAAEE